MRPGRLDRILFVGPPDIIGREEILGIRTKIMMIGPDFDIGKIVSLHSTSVHFCWLAAKGMTRQITPAVLQKYLKWRDGFSAGPH
jgi:AAA family ATPase